MLQTIGGLSDSLPEASRWYSGLPTHPATMWEVEKSLFLLPDKVLYVTEEDRNYVKERSPESTGQIFPILRRQERRSPTDNSFDPPVLAIVGAMTHGPNVDAVDHFLHSTLPVLVSQGIKCQIHIWGSGIDGFSRTHWESDLVRVRGWFPDWSTVAESATLTLAPLRYGAGLKGKTLSSILAGLPVIGSPIAFEGLELSTLKDGVYRSTGELAALLFDLTSSATNRTELIERQQQVVCWRHTKDAEQQRVASLFLASETASDK
jgi:hypothetical protein